MFFIFFSVKRIWKCFFILLSLFIYKKLIISLHELWKTPPYRFVIIMLNFFICLYVPDHLITHFVDARWIIHYGYRVRLDSTFTASFQSLKTFSCIFVTFYIRFSTLFITLRAKLSGAVYCYRSCLWRARGLAVFVGGCVGGAITTITQNCVHRSSPNWVCR